VLADDQKDVAPIDTPGGRQSFTIVGGNVMELEERVLALERKT
jgi:hypothetical protein